MQDQTGITITNDLDLRDMQRAGDLLCDTVVDLRFTDAASARPVEEEVLLRLRNLQIDYAQLPIDMHSPRGWQKNDLMRRITAGRTRVMIVTDQLQAVRAFCRDIDVPEIHNPQEPASTVHQQQRAQPAATDFQQSEAA